MWGTQKSLQKTKSQFLHQKGPLCPGGYNILDLIWKCGLGGRTLNLSNFSWPQRRSPPDSPPPLFFAPFLSHLLFQALFKPINARHYDCAFPTLSDESFIEKKMRFRISSTWLLILGSPITDSVPPSKPVLLASAPSVKQEWQHSYGRHWSRMRQWVHRCRFPSASN